MILDFAIQSTVVLSVVYFGVEFVRYCNRRSTEAAAQQPEPVKLAEVIPLPVRPAAIAPEPVKPYEEMTVRQLRPICLERGIQWSKGASGKPMKKAEMVAALRAKGGMSKAS